MLFLLQVFKRASNIIIILVCIAVSIGWSRELIKDPTEQTILLKKCGYQLLGTLTLTISGVKVLSLLFVSCPFPQKIIFSL